MGKALRQLLLLLTEVRNAPLSAPAHAAHAVKAAGVLEARVQLAARQVHRVWLQARLPLQVAGHAAVLMLLALACRLLHCGQLLRRVRPCSMIQLLIRLREALRSHTK